MDTLILILPCIVLVWGMSIAMIYLFEYLKKVQYKSSLIGKTVKIKEVAQGSMKYAANGYNTDLINGLTGIIKEVTEYGDKQYSCKVAIPRQSYSGYVTEDRYNVWLKDLELPKEVTEKVKRGGEQKMKRRSWPRIVRWALYSALIVLVWKIVLSVDVPSLTNFVSHTFFVHSGR